MRFPGWVLTGLLLVACAKVEAEPSTPPSIPKTESEDPAPEPSAALRRDLRTCEATTDGVKGNVEYGVRVAPGGNVVVVKALRSSVSPALLNCTVQRLRAWEFPASAKGAAFRFSMAFGQGKQPVHGGDKRGLKTTIKHRASVLQHCYNEALRQNLQLSGKVSYQIAISRAGHVVSARATLDPAANLSPEMIECSLEKIRAWEFPMSGAESGADVAFSVVFTGSPPR